MNQIAVVIVGADAVEVARGIFSDCALKPGTHVDAEVGEVLLQGIAREQGLADGVSLALVEFSLNVLAGTASGVLAAWLFDKLKNRSLTNVYINQEQVSLTGGNAPGEAAEQDVEARVRDALERRVLG